LLPGLLCDERLWAAQIEGLEDAARCRVPDLTAFESISAMADGVLSRAPDRFALAGFSMGGCVALEVVARAPQRVCQVALLSTVVAGLPPPVREHYLRSIPAIEAGGLADYLASSFPLYVAPDQAQDRGLWSTFDAMGESLGPTIAVRQMRALLGYTGFSGDLGRIRCPTIVVGGREDRRTPLLVQAAMAETIPGGTLRIIERSGHFTPLEQPQAVTDALREWLVALAGKCV
jgi:pimeloyl-ACP methyl ester carboxylesterase